MHLCVHKKKRIVLNVSYSLNGCIGRSMQTETDGKTTVVEVHY